MSSYDDVGNTLNYKERIQVPERKRGPFAGDPVGRLCPSFPCTSFGACARLSRRPGSHLVGSLRGACRELGADHSFVGPGTAGWGRGLRIPLPGRLLCPCDLLAPGAGPGTTFQINGLQANP